MKKNFKKISVSFALLIITIFCLPLFASAVETITPAGYEDKSSSLVYNVVNLKEDSAVDWYSPSWAKRATWTTEIDGEMEFSISDYDICDAFGIMGSDPIPYFDVKISLKNGNTNCSLANISNAEIALALTLGYSGFQPGIQVRNNEWDTLADYAHAQSSVEQSWAPGNYDLCDVIITNDTGANTVTYDFKQTTGMMQNTTLKYDKLTGYLLYAKTQTSANYWLEIEFKDKSIPGFELYALLGSALIGIVSIIAIKSKRKIIIQ